MGLAHSPRIVTNGLVFAFDSDNIKSYKGPAIQNMASDIVATGQSGTGIVFTASTESVFIPSIGQVTSPKITGYNNYSGVSSACCPQIYYYVAGNGNVSVSPSTTYTYAIVYKTTSGYTHPNFMYRYEYNGGTYVTEVGIHNDTNRIHLGDGWYWAWGTFTTSATTNLVALRCFYYKYGTTNDNIYIAKVLMTPGNFTGLHPSRWPDVNTTRSNTSIMYDISGQNNHMVGNSLTYASNGSFSFNGSNNFVKNINNTLADNLTEMTVSVWVYANWSSVGQYGPIVTKISDAATGGGWDLGARGSAPGDFYFYTQPAGGSPYNFNYTSPVLTNNTWSNLVVSYTAGYTNFKFYLNGSPVNSTVGGSGTISSITTSSAVTFATRDGPNTFGVGYFPCRIAITKIYNRALSAAEVSQNFNALRGRFGL